MKCFYTFLVCLISMIGLQGQPTQSIETSSLAETQPANAAPAQSPSREGRPASEVKLRPMTYLLLSLSVAIGPIVIYLLFRKNKR